VATYVEMSEKVVMPDLIIENAPEETVRALETLAERRHTSVSEVALEYLPKKAPRSAERRLAGCDSSARRPVRRFCATRHRSSGAIATEYRRTSFRRRRR
jgi:hypothetical protein